MRWVPDLEETPFLGVFTGWANVMQRRAARDQPLQSTLSAVRLPDRIIAVIHLVNVVRLEAFNSGADAGRQLRRFQRADLAMATIRWSHADPAVAGRVHGGHAFGLRKTKDPITDWPQLVERWLRTIGMVSQ